MSDRVRIWRGPASAHGPEKSRVYDAETAAKPVGRNHHYIEAGWDFVEIEIEFETRAAQEPGK